MLQAGIAPATNEKLSDIAARIFGHVTNPAGPGHRSGRKILERRLRGPDYVDWYPTPYGKKGGDGPKLTEIQMRRKEKAKALRIAGKGPPKKGEGKRSKK